jgi:SAM-dependent methyltransferase
MKPSTTRFSDRVEDYIKYRPGYPLQIIDILGANIGLNSRSVIADIGSGTGISSGLFLNNGNKVYGVEPNNEMRGAAELFYLNDANFVSINGTAEQTKLKKHSIDIIFSAQAFHWFNKEETKIEFSRIAKPNGHIVLVWNVRQLTGGFQKEYESILKKILEYNNVTHRNISDKEIQHFFVPKIMYKEGLPNFQSFNLGGLKGRLLSSSYCPKEGALHNKLMNEIENLFNKFEKQGVIPFEYETQIYWC